MATTEIEADATFLNIVMELRNDITTLMRQEVALVKSELKAKAAVFLKIAVFLTGSLVVSLYAFFFVLFSLDKMLAAGMATAGVPAVQADFAAPLILGGLLGACAWLLTRMARKQSRSGKLPGTALSSARSGNV